MDRVSPMMSPLPTPTAARRELRKAFAVNVLVFGVDANRQPIHCECSTVDISANGARLVGAQEWRLGDIVGIRHGAATGRFRIVWIGSPGSHSEAQIGLQAMEVGRQFWGIDLPQAAPAHNTTSIPSRIGGVTESTPKSTRISCMSTSAPYANPRRYQRLRCKGGVRIVLGGVNHWGRIVDISLGGCYIECPSNYRVGQVVDLKIGIGEFKFESEGIVRDTHTGLGVGIEFVRTSLPQRGNLEEYVAILARESYRMRR